MDWWQTIVSCLATLLSGAFTFFGVFLTLKHQKKKEKELEEKEKFNNRPNLTIEEFKDIHKYDENELCDVSVVITQPKTQPKSQEDVEYDLEDLDKNKWQSITYKFKNVGATQINLIKISTDCIGSTVIFKVNEIKDYIPNYKMFKAFVNFERMLKNNDTFILKINYPFIPAISKSNILNMSLWLIDINGNYWKQPFNQLKNDLSVSVPATQNEFKIATTYVT